MRHNNSRDAEWSSSLIYQKTPKRGYSLTIKFHVDFAINLNMAQAKQHEYWRLARIKQRATEQQKVSKKQR